MGDEANETTITALREDLARRGREAHQQLEALLAPLSEEQLTRPGVTGDWSAKDHLVHLPWWGRRVIMSAEGEDDPIDAMPISVRTEDEVNATVYAANRDRPFADVWEDFEATHRDMQQLIERFVPDALLVAVESWISGNSDYHYHKHIAMLQAWLAGQHAGE